MVSWTVAALVLSYGFTSCLIASLTKPAMEKPMRTWQDLIDNNYTILTPKFTIFGRLSNRTSFDKDILVGFIRLSVN